MRFFLALALLVAALLLANHFNHASARYAFFGDSLTYQWHFPRVDDGKWGETTAQMLPRFSRTIPGHGYAKVFLLAGTNDVLKDVPLPTTLQNISTMIDLALQSHTEPVLAEIPPMPIEGGRFDPHVRALNAGITQIAQNRGLKVIDYYTALDGHSSEMNGIHMKHLSYLRMEFALLRVTNPF